MHATAEPEIREGDTRLNLQPLTDESVKELVQLFKLLADETRMRILHFLHQADELNVLELCTLLEQRQPSVSHHLALLRVAGLIDMRRDGKHNYYRIVRPKFEEFARKVFDVAPSGPFRMLFDDHELRYGPVGTE
ncbi:MAG: transcriptional regulator [Planctomycetaceae bacterium]|nr:transcriptional regulator [Planctomycetaceae bacterium]